MKILLAGFLLASLNTFAAPISVTCKSTDYEIILKDLGHGSYSLEAKWTDFFTKTPKSAMGFNNYCSFNPASNFVWVCRGPYPQPTTNSMYSSSEIGAGGFPLDDAGEVFFNDSIIINATFWTSPSSHEDLRNAVFHWKECQTK